MQSNAGLSAPLQSEQFSVVIDPGHGGRKSGAVGPSGLLEKDVTLDVGLRLNRLLDCAGYRVFLTRVMDSDVDLSTRCWHANSFGADLFVSLHCNGWKTEGPHGFEVFTSPGTTAADYAATLMIEQIQAEFPYHKGRFDYADGDADKESPFVVLMDTNMPAVLVEMAFITNPIGELLLSTGSWKQRMVLALRGAIIAFEGASRVM